MQFDGSVSGVVQANAQAQLGILQPAFRPVLSAKMPIIAVLGNLVYGFGQLLVTPNGEVFIRPSIESAIVVIDATWALD